MMILIVVLALVVGLAAGLGAALAVVRRQQAAAAADAQRAAQAALVELRTQAVTDRDEAVRQAIDHALRLAGERLTATTDRAQADLAGKKDVIDARLDQVGADLRHDLARVSELVESLRTSSASSFGTVTAQLADHAQTTRELGAATASLREILVSPKARGQWGERMADDVLRLAGLREHINYRKQKAVEGGRSIPDVTFLLPKGHVLYLDVKFPLDSYVRHLQATTDSERDRYRIQFLRDVRVKVRELAGRHYATSERRALRPVLLFIPNEAIFQFVHEHDPGLVEEALGAEIVLCSPLTLFAMLAVIRQAYESFATEQTSDEILRVLGAFREQWERFASHLDKLGDRLDSSQRCYAELNGVRRRQLERPLDRIEELRRSKGLAADPNLKADAAVLALEGRDAG
jgi:DNA recombination protein RmuC